MLVRLRIKCGSPLLSSALGLKLLIVIAGHSTHIEKAKMLFKSTRNKLLKRKFLEFNVNFPESIVMFKPRPRVKPRSEAPKIGDAFSELRVLLFGKQKNGLCDTCK